MRQNVDLDSDVHLGLDLDLDLDLKTPPPPCGRGLGEGAVSPLNRPLPPTPSRKGRGRISFRPADAVANDFFRARRFIGSGDRRAVSDRVWRVLRTYRRLGWWLGEQPNAAPDGGRLAAAGGRDVAPTSRTHFPVAASRPRRGTVGTGDRCTASKATRWTTRPCRTPCGWRCRTGCCRTSTPTAANCAPCSNRPRSTCASTC